MDLILRVWAWFKREWKSTMWGEPERPFKRRESDYWDDGS